MSLRSRILAVDEASFLSCFEYECIFGCSLQLSFHQPVNSARLNFEHGSGKSCELRGKWMPVIHVNYSHVSSHLKLSECGLWGPTRSISCVNSACCSPRAIVIAGAAHQLSLLLPLSAAAALFGVVLQSLLVSFHQGAGGWLLTLCRSFCATLWCLLLCEI